STRVVTRLDQSHAILESVAECGAVSTTSGAMGTAGGHAAPLRGHVDGRLEPSRRRDLSGRHGGAGDLFLCPASAIRGFDSLPAAGGAADVGCRGRRWAGLMESMD